MRAADRSRRAFLESIGLAGAVAMSATESARGYLANDTINVACLGTGGRCQALMRSLRTVPGVRIAAVCDVYEPRREAARKLADPSAVASGQFKELLDRKDIDAVLIGAPDHWHVPITVAACEAGKDVYVEKPLTHNLDEGAAVVAAQDKSKRIVQGARSSGACRASRTARSSSTPAGSVRSSRPT